MTSIFTLKKDQDIATIIMVNGNYKMIEVRRTSTQFDDIILYSTNCEELRIKMTIQAIIREWVQLNIVDIKGDITDVNIRY